jgi:hypothetical protein
VHPDVVASYLDGTLAAALKRRVDGHPTGRRLHGLRPEEAAVLALLQRRLDQEKRGTRLETQLRRSLRASHGNRRRQQG